MKTTPYIFISIASYRDSELIPTLLDMIKTSDHPERLRVGICWQHDEKDASLFLDAGMNIHRQDKHQGFDLYTLRYENAVIKALSIHYFDSKGACWARYMTESLYQDEDYFLQIDSHCRFSQGWDTEMISMQGELKNKSKKPILSGYPPAYIPEFEHEKKHYVGRLIFREFNNDGIVMLTSEHQSESSPVRGCFLAGGFIFSDGSFVKDIPNDPLIFFAGEEISMAARAFTHGYDVYYPHKPLLWHFYERPNHTKVWSDHTGEAKESGSIDLTWWDRDNISKKRIRTLFDLETEEKSDLGKFTLGNKRTLKEFEHVSGVDFRKCAVQPEVVGKERVGFFIKKTENDEEWQNKLIVPNTKKVSFEKSEIDVELEKISYLYIGAYSHNNVLLEQKKINKDELIEIMNNDEKSKIEISLNFNTSLGVKPFYIRMCPFIESQGWGNTTEKSW
ncbi:GlcNAc-transferase family protein [Rouxiella sp. Mn2063]|uniref:GlcNAc-transferase family protein n=1 Tax=Rouxiella sp. Mn2063 TaxID=3395262 RepID=UPI003BCCED4E